MTHSRAENRQSGVESPVILVVQSGPANPDLPYRYGCRCGAVWNASASLEGTDGHLCGPHCIPHLFPLENPDA